MQVFITFETYYSIFYMVFLFLIEFYKGKSLASYLLEVDLILWCVGYGGLLFPPNVWGLEMACICVFFLL